ncbi:transporter substrate-binding domain-containing protein [Tomitella biformata]|uniref:transporter substrate-binding domain-containing protein n=1 Tax=Tomitella biformata TaxID=630403 RepID=UPI0004654820|nr:transporter substrate-binding domain-containing protein [Tomitella biformata]
MAPLSRRGFLAGLGGLGTAAVLASCGYFRPGDTLQRARDAGFITVGHSGIAPFSFYDESLAGPNPLTGAAVAVDRAVFAKLGVPEVRGVSTQLADLIPGLLAGRYDAICTNLAITPGRCPLVAFGEPVFRSEPALLVPAGNPMRLSDYESALLAPARVGAITGSIEAEQLAALGIVSTSVDTPAAAMVAMRDQRVDACALNAVALAWMVEHDALSPVEVTSRFTPVLDGAAWLGASATAFRPADTTLLQAYNEQLAKLDPVKILSLTGEFGIAEGDLPEPWMSTAALCG